MPLALPVHGNSKRLKQRIGCELAATSDVAPLFAAGQREANSKDLETSTGWASGTRLRLIHPMSHPFILAITGASGAVYATRLLEIMLRAGHTVHVTLSPSARPCSCRNSGCESTWLAFARGCC